MSETEHPDGGGEGFEWVAHGRRDQPPGWLLRWEHARRPMLLLGGALVLIAIGPAFLVADAGLLRIALSVGWLGLLVMIAGLWQPARLRSHAAWLTEVRPPMDDAGAFPRSVVASCTCGWHGPGREAVGQAAADAGAHAGIVDPRVERPLG